jgi:hypothetical protein
VAKGFSFWGIGETVESEEEEDGTVNVRVGCSSGLRSRPNTGKKEEEEFLGWVGVLLGATHPAGGGNRDNLSLKLKWFIVIFLVLLYLSDRGRDVEIRSSGEVCRVVLLEREGSGIYALRAGRFRER